MVVGVVVVILLRQHPPAEGRRKRVVVGVVVATLLPQGSLNWAEMGRVGEMPKRGREAARGLEGFQNGVFGVKNPGNGCRLGAFSWKWAPEGVPFGPIVAPKGSKMGFLGAKTLGIGSNKVSIFVNFCQFL